MTDLFRLFIIVILLAISLAAYFLVIGALFPVRVTKGLRYPADKCAPDDNPICTGTGNLADRASDERLATEWKEKLVRSHAGRPSGREHDGIRQDHPTDGESPSRHLHGVRRGRPALRRRYRSQPGADRLSGRLPRRRGAGRQCLRCADRRSLRHHRLRRLSRDLR